MKVLSAALSLLLSLMLFLSPVIAAAEFYNGQFNTYTFDQGDQFILNFYRTDP